MGDAHPTKRRPQGAGASVPSVERDGREFMAIFPTQWRKGRPKGSAGSAGSAGFSIWSSPHTRGTPHTTPLTSSEGANPPLVQNEIATSLLDVIRSLTNDGATAEHAAIIRVAQDRVARPGPTTTSPWHILHAMGQLRVVPYVHLGEIW